MITVAKRDKGVFSWLLRLKNYIVSNQLIHNIAVNGMPPRLPSNHSYIFRECNLHHFKERRVTWIAARALESTGGCTTIRECDCVKQLSINRECFLSATISISVKTNISSKRNTQFRPVCNYNQPKGPGFGKAFPQETSSINKALATFSINCVFFHCL